MSRPKIAEELKSLLAGIRLDAEKISLKADYDCERGEFSTNALFIFMQEFKSSPLIKKAEISGEGFINFSLSEAFWQEKLKEILIGDFPVTEVKPLSDSEIFPVQYAYSRAVSVLKHGERLWGKNSFSKADISLLKTAEEIKLIRLMTNIPLSLYNLSEQFAKLWDEERGDVEMRFLSADDKAVSEARLALIYALTLVIADGLSILGVKITKEIENGF